MVIIRNSGLSFEELEALQEVRLPIPCQMLEAELKLALPFPG